MTTTLFSFLGKGRVIGRDGEPQVRYTETIYAFPDGHQVSTEYFGLALADVLDVERLVILGTAGSMWDVLLESLIDDERYQEERLALMDAADHDAVTQAHLDELRPLISEAAGRDVRLQLIPYGRDITEQLSILTTVAEHVSPDDRISLDVTHGFRYLPMLSMLSAQYLEAVGHARLEGIYYGAFDMKTNGSTPVVKLAGLMQLADWIAALKSYDKDGDYGVFVPLLKQEGVAEDQLRCLEDAAFYERIFNLGGAREKLNTFLPVLDQPLPGPGALFTDALRDRLKWARRADRSAQQWHHAHFYLDRGDYARAAIFGCEAVLSSLLKPGERVTEHEDRELAETELRAGERGTSRLHTAYEELKGIRNAFAHGTRPRSHAARQDVKNSDVLKTKLTQLFRELKNAKP